MAALALLVTKYMVANVFFMLIFIFAVWYALDLLELEFDMPWWLSITFFTYVFHDMILEMLEKLVFVFGGANPLFALLDYMFIPLITFGVIVLVASGLRRLKPLWSVLCGFR